MAAFLMFWMGIAVSTIGADILQQEPLARDLKEYKIAKIEITNADPLRPRALVDKVFSVYIGNVYDPQALEDGLEIIEGLYENLGFVDFRYERSIEHPGTVDIFIRIAHAGE